MPHKSHSFYNNNNNYYYGDERESAFLFQRLSVVIQRFNTILQFAPQQF